MGDVSGAVHVELVERERERVGWGRMGGGGEDGERGDEHCMEQ